MGSDAHFLGSSHRMDRLRLYRIALAVSVAINVLLTAAIALYIHFAGLLDMVISAVSFFN